MGYDYDVKIETADYEVAINTGERRGYFEHNTLGDERGGGLWFEVSPLSTKGDAGLKLELTDYDGVAVLPKQVREALRENGYIVGEEFE